MSETVTTKVKTRWQRVSQKIRITIVVLIVLFVAIRLALPYIVEDYVNRQLRKIPDYSGRIGKVTIELWRGAYVIQDINIKKAEGTIPVPFFSTPRMDLSVQWKELFHGAIVGKVLVDKPQVNFVGGSTPQEKQTGENQPWGQTLKSLFPFNINRFEIRDGQVRFKSFNKSEPVDLFVTNLNAVATNLNNSRDLKNPLPAGLQATGETLGGGQLSINLMMNPLASAPTFQVDATLTNLDLPALNSFLRSYGKFDVAGGNFSAFTTVASDQGNYKGVIKVLFRHLDVFEWEKERKKNILQMFWEAVVGTVAVAFKNHPHDQLAANIPVSGSFANSHVAVLYAVGSTLHNAFIRALVPRITRSETIQDVKTKGPAVPPEHPTSTNSFVAPATNQFKAGVSNSPAQP
jgi:uncharacterized protein involved in outer membrane biogenesis